MTHMRAGGSGDDDPNLALRLWFELAVQRERLAMLEQQLSRMKSSRSWRITAPLRAAFRRLSGTAQLARPGGLARCGHSHGVKPSLVLPFGAVAALLEGADAKKRLFIDVTELALEDLGAGVQRVTRRLLSELLLAPPAGYHVQPVRLHADSGYCAANEFLASFLGLDRLHLGTDVPVEPRRGDCFVGLDFCRDRADELAPALEALRQGGASIALLVHDVLPLSRPDWFPEWVSANYESWLRVLSSQADLAMCISAHTAGELARALSERSLPAPPAGLSVVTLGSDIPPLPENCTELPRRQSGVCRVLTVGTIEPRKGHAQALDAFEAIWSKGGDIEWMIIGRPGWHVDRLLQRLREHPEAGKRLHWLDAADDAVLSAAYRASDVLLAPSLGEGFGLPVAEAGRLGLKLVLRDLAVFREVAGGAAVYFSGETPQAIVQALTDAQSHRGSSRGEWNSWADAAVKLASCATAGQPPAGDRPFDGHGREV
ncbi:glycosyltransferase family 4 protein [Pseudoxanthomonas daejeonensis]|uniref:glycosyltransferase family 4 protein n=1 Tax=Pseudoxanthomonas daejeonensis TaxID=266062 RepID=UPI001F548186|nr:glycosyltransferase family 1 protein [Pseudoxanthomonas daejeonensis]UNK56436.1 glycosyltransferase family 4 protein [Pseudoxanthomonas daejeonensis]